MLIELRLNQQILNYQYVKVIIRFNKEMFIIGFFFKELTTQPLSKINKSVKRNFRLDLFILFYFF